MAFYGCFVGYFLIYRPLMQGKLLSGKGWTKLVLASVLASANPDGLEWSLFGNEEAGYSANMGLDEEAYGAESAAAEKAAAVQEKTSLLPDYNFAGSDSAAGTSVSGLIGCTLVAALAAIISLAGRAARKKSGKKQASAG